MAIKKFIDKLLLAGANETFFVLVKCSECGEEVKVRMSHASDIQIEYSVDNPRHCYTIKKEIIGKDCFNLMTLTLAMTKRLKVLFSETTGCKFIRLSKG